MSRTLDSGDAQYANILALIGVDDDNSTVREFKSGTALTKETGVTVQSGNYGYDFNVKQNGAFNGFGIDLTGLSGGGISIDASGSTKPISVFVVFNSLNATGATADILGSGSDTGYPNIRFSGTNNRQITGCLGVQLTGLQATNQLAASTAASICYTFKYGDSSGRNLYLNGSSIASGAEAGFGGTGLITKIGYFPGQGSIDANIAFVVILTTQLSSSEVLRLHNSLTGGGNFALLTGGGAGAAALAGDAHEIQSGTGALTTSIVLAANAIMKPSAAGANSWPAHHAIYIINNLAGVAQPGLTGIDYALFDGA